jgi:Tfp pilus assembly ATPase PilU
MISFDQSLSDLVRGNLVTYEEALASATNPDDFALAFRGVSRGANTVDAPRAGEEADLDLDAPDELEPGFQIDRFKKR